VEAPEREFRAPGGTGLIPRNGAALVVLPGSGSNRSAVLGQAAVLAGTATGRCWPRALAYVNNVREIYS
jgi:hypothetical protein